MGAAYLKEMPYWATLSYPDFHTSVTSQAFVACSRHDKKAETALPPTVCCQQDVRRCMQASNAKNKTKLVLQVLLLPLAAGMRAGDGIQNRSEGAGGESYAPDKMRKRGTAGAMSNGTGRVLGRGENETGGDGGPKSWRLVPRYERTRRPSNEN
jgi:hypothetical protein